MPDPVILFLKAYIHGHYRIDKKSGKRIWIESYTDKRPERKRTAFTDWGHRVKHFEDHLTHGKQREALHAFHDLSHDDAHRLASDLGLHHGDKHASKRELMESIHGKLGARAKELSEGKAAEVRADWEKRKGMGKVGKPKKPVKQESGQEKRSLDVHTVYSGGKPIRTTDSPLNSWVRSVEDGKFYQVDPERPDETELGKKPKPKPVARDLEKILSDPMAKIPDIRDAILRANKRMNDARYKGEHEKSDVLEKIKRQLVKKLEDEQQWESEKRRAPPIPRQPSTPDEKELDLARKMNQVRNEELAAKKTPPAESQLPKHDESRVTTIARRGDYEFGIGGNAPHPSESKDRHFQPGFTLKMRRTGRDWEPESYGWNGDASGLLERVAAGRSSAGSLNPDEVLHPELKKLHDEHLRGVAERESAAKAKKDAEQAEYLRKQKNEASIAERMKSVKWSRAEVEIPYAYMNARGTRKLSGWRIGDFFVHKSIGKTKSQPLWTVTHIPSGTALKSNLQGGSDRAKELAYRASLLGSDPKPGDSNAISDSYGRTLAIAWQGFVDREPIAGDAPKAEDNSKQRAEIAQKLRSLLNENNRNRGFEEKHLPVDPTDKEYKFADALLGKDGLALTDVMQHNLIDAKYSPAKRKIFEDHTGIKLPKTQKGSREAIHNWAGVTENDKKHAEHSKNLALAESKVRREEDAVRRNQRVGNADEAIRWAKDTIAAGYNDIQKIGNVWALVNPETGRGYSLSKRNTLQTVLRPLLESMIEHRKLSAPIAKSLTLFLRP